MLEEKVKQLCTGANYGALTTLFPSGDPQTQVMWVDCDDEHVIINTEVHRAKFQNVANDSRVTITIWELGNPYSYVEVRGRAVEFQRGQDAVDHINALARKYTDADHSKPIKSERVIVKIRPDRTILH